MRMSGDKNDQDVVGLEVVRVPVRAGHGTIHRWAGVAEQTMSLGRAW